jgi:hypothetical protein
VIKAGWYDSPDGCGARWWTGETWSATTSSVDARLLRVGRTTILTLATVAWLAASLFIGPQAFGIEMMNFDEHLIDSSAALEGLLGFAVLASVLLIAGVMAHRWSRSPRLWRTGTYLLAAVLLLEAASIVGLTEQIGLLLFG